MASKFRRELEALKTAEPGTRFELGYERTHIRNHVVRLMVVGLGLALMAVAAVTFWLPGPNFVLVFAGLVMVGGQSKVVARAMDRAEVTARRWREEVWEPYPHKLRVRVIVAAVLLVGAGLLVWLADERGWIPSWVPILG